MILEKEHCILPFMNSLELFQNIGTHPVAIDSVHIPKVADLTINGFMMLKYLSG